MKSLVAVAALLIPASVGAQAGPYKLVLTWSQNAITVVDYPSAARCEQARRAVEAERDRRIEEVKRRPPPVQGAITIGQPTTVYGFCIPG